jgi:hypothetical protein
VHLVRAVQSGNDKPFAGNLIAYFGKGGVVLVIWVFRRRFRSKSGSS